MYSSYTKSVVQLGDRMILKFNLLLLNYNQGKAKYQPFVSQMQTDYVQRSKQMLLDSDKHPDKCWTKYRSGVLDTVVLMGPLNLAL